MSPKRPSSPPKPSTASGSTSPSRTPDPPSKRTKRSSDILSGHSIHILHPKLDSSRLAHLHAIASSSGASLAPTPAQADVIVTAIGMRKRLERHIDWAAAQSKAVVRPAWLEDSVARGRALPCADYAALRDLKTSTAASCPDPNPTHASEGDAHESHSTEQHSYLSSPADPPPFSPADFDPFERYSCRRPCPLVCPTQDLVEDLDVIRRSRVLEGEERSALSYARAIGVIKSYPKRISRETLAEVQKLPNLGAKLLKMIGEWLDTGEIAEIETIKASDRFTSLSAFASIYGIGPTTARRLYNLGVRTLTELEVYYEVEPGSPPPSVEPVQSRGDEKRTADDEEDEKDAWIKIALALRHDFAKKISRAEAERIRALVGTELESLQPGCEGAIVGGYRRGKDECGDVDLVFTHPDGGKVPGLAKRLVKVLHEKSLVTHVIHSSGFRAHNPLRTSQFDALEKALTVFRLPGPDQPARRVDLVFTLPETYWTAIVGWTGSMMFERDLRSVAKDKGMKFDSSGISRRHDSKLFFPRSEKEVFDLFDLRWIPPEWRNTDV